MSAQMTPKDFGLYVRQAVIIKYAISYYMNILE